LGIVLRVHQTEPRQRSGFSGGSALAELTAAGAAMAAPSFMSFTCEEK
jgi:hypothetical protein